MDEILSRIFEAEKDYKKTIDDLLDQRREILESTRREIERDSEKERTSVIKKNHDTIDKTIKDAGEEKAQEIEKIKKQKEKLLSNSELMDQLVEKIVSILVS